MLVLHELSFGRADFVRASKGALELGFERFVALEGLSRVVLLGFFFFGQPLPAAAALPPSDMTKFV